MNDNKIIEAIQSSGRLNRSQSRILEVLYKTSIENESDVTHAFLASKLNNCAKAYISRIIKELVELKFISLKYPKGSNNQVFILNTQNLELLVQSYELRLAVD